MNPAFFQSVEAILAPERLDAYRQDGAPPATTLARYLWNQALCESLYPPLQMAVVLDRFTELRRQGLNPWLERLNHHWPDPGAAPPAPPTAH